jgi:hypothetical protein
MPKRAEPRILAALLARGRAVAALQVRDIQVRPPPSRPSPARWQASRLLTRPREGRPLAAWWRGGGYFRLLLMPYNWE